MTYINQSEIKELLKIEEYLKEALAGNNGMSEVVEYDDIKELYDLVHEDIDFQLVKR